MSAVSASWQRYSRHASSTLSVMFCTVLSIQDFSVLNDLDEEGTAARDAKAARSTTNKKAEKQVMSCEYQWQSDCSSWSEKTAVIVATVSALSKQGATPEDILMVWTGATGSQASRGCTQGCPESARRLRGNCSPQHNAR